MSELFGNPEQVSELSGNSEQLPYTPTTEEVREIYFESGYKTTPEEFDRWLAEERNKVRETSRQIYEQRGRTSERESLMNGVIIGAALAGVTLLVIQVLMTGGI